MQVREAKHTDTRAIADLYQALNEEHSAILPQIFSKAGRESIEWHVFSIFGNANSVILVAEDEEIIGFAHVTFEQVRNNPMFVDRSYAWVHNLFVRKDKRRQGVGRALMEGAERWGSAKGAISMELTVWEANEDALRFYESLGFGTLNRHLIKQQGTGAKQC